MNFEEVNMLKEDLVDSLVPSIDDLRSDIKGVDVICKSLVLEKNDSIKTEALKLAMEEICNANPDLHGRVDEFYHPEENIIDKTCANQPLVVKGVVWLLFLEKDKDKYDHEDIDRLYVEHPEFFTGYFDEYHNWEHCAFNQYTKDLFKRLVKVKERNIYFMHLKREKSKILDTLIKEITLDTEFIENAVIDRAKQEGLMRKTVQLMLNTTEYNEHIFLYKSENEKIINKCIRALENQYQQYWKNL